MNEMPLKNSNLKHIFLCTFLKLLTEIVFQPSNFITVKGEILAVMDGEIGQDFKITL